MTDIADTIRQLRLTRGWSQEQLAGIAGISARTVQRLEQGQPPALETLKALAAAFGIGVADLRKGPEPLTKDDTMDESTPAVPARDPARIFRRHLLVFAGVMSGLSLFNLIHNPDHLWVIYPALGWGVPLAIKALSLRRPPPPLAG
jgi:transcriptional regulator with XRE-family HTH domain